MDYNRTNIIASLATTPGISAISIIRISGSDLASLYQSITKNKTFKDRYAAYCKIFSKNQKIILDKCILIYYVSPNSYTGEDVIEINCHGGNIVAQSILNMLYEHGVQPALPGEFSYRAFLNNKINLIEAEAISSLIHSESEYSNEIILDHLNNKLTKQILEINSQIINILTIIEHELDFSEDEIDHITNESILKILQKISITINQYLSNKQLVQIMNNGINVVIVGHPNAGKSSLFNKMIGKNRTIVSSVKGTTRDSVEVRLIINQYPINLIDTAGYFKATDQINIESVEQTIKYAKNADIIIYLDEKNPMSEYKKMKITCENIIFCKSKQDNINIKKNNDKSLNISSKTEDGINTLRKELSTMLSTKYEYDFKNDKFLISNRQIIIFEKAQNIIEDMKNMIKVNIGMDIIASHMHELTNLFDECLGKISNEEILNSIFSDFCVGK